MIMKESREKVTKSGRVYQLVSTLRLTSRVKIRFVSTLSQMVTNPLGPTPMPKSEQPIKFL